MGKTLKELILQMKVFAEHGDNVSDQLFDIIQQQADDIVLLRKALEYYADPYNYSDESQVTEFVAKEALDATDPNRVIGE